MEKLSGKSIADIETEIQKVLGGLKFGLTPPDVAKLLGINKTAGYQLFHRKGFPKILIGKRLISPAYLFLRWLEEESFKTSLG
jgi:hypothetical protein